MAKFLDNELPEIVLEVERAMSYPVDMLFADAKKKQYDAAVRAVDSYYSIMSRSHQEMRSLMHEAEACLILISGVYAYGQLAQAIGQLQAEYQAHMKVIKEATKTNPVLKAYYFNVEQHNWFDVFFNAYVSVAHKDEIDSAKRVYSDALRLRKEEIAARK